MGLSRLGKPKFNSEPQCCIFVYLLLSSVTQEFAMSDNGSTVIFDILAYLVSAIMVLAPLSLVMINSAVPH
jgi:hypothetical protein